MTDTTMTTNAAMTETRMEDRILPDKTIGQVHVEHPRMTARAVDVHYGTKKAIDSVTLDIGERQVISFIGPSGCGKSTFLRCLNRMNDTIDICKVSGLIAIDEQDIYDPSIDVV